MSTPQSEQAPISAVTSATCVIFGASGDLTRRKLVPALYHLLRDKQLGHGIRTIGVARRPKTNEGFQEELLEAAKKHARSKEIDPGVWANLATNVSYIQGTFEARDTYAALEQALLNGPPGVRVFYLAVGAEDMLGIIKQLSEAGLLTEHPERGIYARVVVEKPFGENLATAEQLNGELYKYLRESQIFRIDHYLGKETVQNLAVLRFENMIFEALWNRNHVSHVEISVAEDIGVEGRGKFYERVGITKDIVQNHVLQLLTLVAMEPPVAFEADALRDEKVKVLRAVRPVEPNDVVRAQYAAGQVSAQAVPGYRSESDVDPASQVETFVALRLWIDNWRWAGVPFYLRSGKRLSKRLAEVVVHFRDPPYAMFPSSAGRSSNALVLRLQPDEGISLRFDTKVPGPGLTIQGVDMAWSYGQAFGNGGPEAYERLLLDAFRGDATLFTRQDEVLCQWRLVDPIVRAFSAGAVPLSVYPAGSEGPEEAAKLMADLGYCWRKIAQQ
jgi:glucose-6-phosphate 1-dehydrogenase